MTIAKMHRRDDDGDWRRHGSGFPMEFVHRLLHQRDDGARRRHLLYLGRPTSVSEPSLISEQDYRLCRSPSASLVRSSSPPSSGR